jgi:hypothetical protein
MIESVINSPIALSSNSSVVTFTKDDLRTRSANCCGWLQHVEGSPLYKILKGGIYEIDLDAVLTSATAGIVALGIYQDGILIPNSVSAQTLTAAGDLASVSSNKKIRICCNADSTLTIASVPSVFAGATPIATNTQIPIIINGTLNISVAR